MTRLLIAVALAAALVPRAQADQQVRQVRVLPVMLKSVRSLSYLAGTMEAERFNKTPDKAAWDNIMRPIDDIIARDAASLRLENPIPKNIEAFVAARKPLLKAAIVSEAENFVANRSAQGRDWARERAIGVRLAAWERFALENGASAKLFDGVRAKRRELDAAFYQNREYRVDRIAARLSKPRNKKVYVAAVKLLRKRESRAGSFDLDSADLIRLRMKAFAAARRFARPASEAADHLDAAVERARGNESLQHMLLFSLRDNDRTSLRRVAADELILPTVLKILAEPTSILVRDFGLAVYAEIRQSANLRKNSIAPIANVILPEKAVAYRNLLRTLYKWAVKAAVVGALLLLLFALLVLTYPTPLWPPLETAVLISFEVAMSFAIWWLKRQRGGVIWYADIGSPIPPDARQ